MIGFLAILAGAALMAVSFFSSSYDQFDELQVLTKEIEQRHAYYERGELPPNDPVASKVFNAEKDRRRQFGFMGGGFLIVAGSVFAAVGVRRRRVISGSTAQSQHSPSPEDPQAREG
jgi:hypothetical protein